jgi:hypothetical protein
LLDDRLVDADQDIIYVVDDFRCIRVVIAYEGKLVDLRSGLIRSIWLPAHSGDRGFEPLLADGQIIGARVDVVDDIDFIPDECIHGEQLFRHAVRDCAEISVAGLEPESDSIFPEVEPLRPGQRNIQLFLRIRRHQCEVQVQRSF